MSATGGRSRIGSDVTLTREERAAARETARRAANPDYAAHLDRLAARRDDRRATADRVDAARGLPPVGSAPPVDDRPAWRRRMDDVRARNGGTAT